MATIVKIQILVTLLLIIGSWKDIRDRKVWKGLSTLFIAVSALTAYFFSSAELTFVILGAPAVCWILEYFKIWTTFDSKMFIGLSLLHASNFLYTVPLTLPLYLIWVTLWKKNWPEEDVPIVPVFLLVHVYLLFL